MISAFENPPAENRPRPFWFFNGDMDRAEVKRQILEMKDKGLGGYFLCARQGLRIPYLSREWFDICKYAVDVSREQGMEVWLYDEYPYPSGMSGGEVTIRHPEAKQKLLELSFRDLEEGASLKESLGQGSLLLALAYPVINGAVQWDNPKDISGNCGILQNQEIYQKAAMGASYRHNFKRYFTYGPSKELRWTAGEGGWKILVAFTREMEDFKYYGTFVDPANEEGVRCFIDTTYEPYKAALGGEFGKTVKGMFGDETSFLGRWPWTPELPPYFREKYGFEIIAHLGALLDPSYPEAKRIRYNYFQCVHELLRDRYHKPLSEWCEKNGIKYVTEVPSARMSNQMYSHVPGGDPCHDKLGYRFENVIDRDFAYIRQNLKIIGAMARQFNRRDAINESFHSLGWTMTLQDAKWQIDRQTLMGISLHNFHAYYYTANGITKHDAPPSQFLQNPYWEYYKTFADYCARSSRFITETESAAEVAILHPAIVWCTWMLNPFHSFSYAALDAAEAALAQRLVDDYKYICKTFFFNQIDYDDLDPEVMALGKIERGAIKIGRAKYTTLVVPPYTCIETYAFKLIRRFVESGGKVVFTGLTPADIIDKDFDPRPAFKEAGFGKLDFSEYYGEAGAAFGEKLSDRVTLIHAPGGLIASKAADELAAAVLAASPAGIEAVIPSKNKGDIIISRRENKDARFIMISSQNGVYADTRVVFHNCPKGAFFCEYDIESGKIFPVRAVKSGADYVVDAKLIPWSARIFSCAASAVPTDGGMSVLRAAAETPEKTLKLKLNLDRPAKVSIAGYNVYRLEDLAVSIDGGPALTAKPKTFIEHFKELGSFKSSQIKFSDGFGLPQRLAVNYPMGAAYHFEFTIAEELVSLSRREPLKVFMMRDRMGIIGGHTLVINKKELPGDIFKPLFVYDQNNITADITSYLKGGVNTVDVFVTVTEDWHGLSDPLYLLGNFGLIKKDGKFILGTAPKSAVPGAGVVEGYPFYSGKFIYTMELRADDPAGNPALIELPECYNIYECVELEVNSRRLGARTFSPYVWIAEAGLLKKGSNEVKLTIANTLGNMLEGCYYNYKTQRTEFIN
jgi:hypothetical protein